MKEHISKKKFDVEEINCKMLEFQTELATAKASCLREKQYSSEMLAN